MTEVTGSEQPTTRDLILDAAESCFARRGYAGVSVREIATDAGLRNQASLYHHFKNKRAIYEAVLTRGMGPLIELMERIGASETTDFDAFLDRIMDHLVANPYLPLLIQRAGLDDGRYMRNVFLKLARPFYSGGINALASFPGSWTLEELPHLAFGIYLIIFGYFANAPLVEIIVEGNPRSGKALARQRKFLKFALHLLLENPLGGQGAILAGGRLRPAQI